MIKYLHENPSPREYNDLRRTVGWRACAESAVELGLSRTLFSIVAREDRAIVGMGRVIGDGILVFYIQDVIVLPSHQARGIGKAIMTGIMEFLKSKVIDNSTIGLMAAVGKEPFYEKFGFVPRPTETLGSGMTIFVRKSADSQD